MKNKFLGIFSFLLLTLLVSSIFASAIEQTTNAVLSSEIDKTFSLGEKTTVTIDGKDVPVEVIGINTQTAPISASIKVNGEFASVTSGNSYILGGMKVHVKDILLYTAPATGGAVRLIIGKEDPVTNYLTVYLDQKFQIKQGQIATVADYKSMTIEYVSPDAVSAPCLKGEECPVTKQSIILKVKIPSIILEQSTNPSTNVFPAPSTEVKFSIAVGETKEVSGVKITLLALDSGVATLIVSKTGTGDNTINAYLDQKFQLKQQQEAVIVDYKNMKIKYVNDVPCPLIAMPCPIDGPCPIQECKKSIKLSITSTDPLKEMIVSTELVLSAGETKEAFGAAISLLDLGNGVATLIVTKSGETEQKSIPVLLNQKFQLKQGEQAGVVDYGNLKIIYLSAASSAPCPKEDSCPITNEFIMLRVEKPYTAILSSGSVTASTATTKIENPLAVPVSKPMTTKDFSIGVGETKEAFGAKISLLSLENGVATLIVSKSPTTRVKRPSCEKIGTKMEGWYAGDELIRYDNCACKAVCKTIAVDSSGSSATVSGFYSSCTGELIKSADCSSTETEVMETSVQTIGGTEEIVQTGVIQIMRNEATESGEEAHTNVIRILPETLTKSEGEVKTGVVQIMSKETATTKERIRVDEGKLKIETSEGAKEIRYMPEEAKKTAIDSGEITEVTTIEIMKVNEKPTYEITGKKKGYFLWIFPVTTEKTVKVNAETNEVIK